MATSKHSNDEQQMEKCSSSSTRLRQSSFLIKGAETQSIGDRSTRGEKRRGEEYFFWVHHPISSDFLFLLIPQDQFLNPRSSGGSNFAEDQVLSFKLVQMEDVQDQKNTDGVKKASATTHLKANINNRGSMTVEERIKAADERKTEGNAYFKDEKLEEAMQQYEMAIAYMGKDFMLQLSGKHRSMALAVKNPCHLNMAACLIKLSRYEEAIVHCSIVLSEDETNVKALFRRGKARAELGKTDAARQDFLTARKYAPEEKAIGKELRLLAELEKAAYQKEKDIYKGIFGPSPEVQEETSDLILDDMSEQAEVSPTGSKLKRRSSPNCSFSELVCSDSEFETKKDI